METVAQHTDADIAALDEEVLLLIQTSDCDSFDETAFNFVALREFAFQFAACEPYRRYCESKRVTPERVSDWRHIPPIPAQAYKEAVIATCPPQRAVHIYQTSGTSSRGSRPGTMYRDAAAERLCRAAQVRAHKEYMLPDREQIVFVLLAPPPELMPRAGVAHCMDLLMRTHGAAGSERFFSPAGLDMPKLARRLEAAEQDGTPVGLYAATFIAVHFFDWCVQNGRRFRLPSGSRMNHGSGYKGRSRELTPAEFLEISEEVLGIDPAYNVNVLGLTELGSQFYDNSLRNRVQGRTGPRHKAALPWARTRILDPLTLEPVPHGQQGVLVHYDLALRGNVLAVQTEDVGVEVGDGFEIQGRLSGAEARGCNLTLEEFLAATTDGGRASE